jgi:hypothetical protein
MRIPLHSSTILASIALLAGCSRPPAGMAEGATVAAPSTPVDPARELVITDLSVVADPIRTAYSPPSREGDAWRAEGAWSFGALMTSLAGTDDPSAFTLRWLRLFERDWEVEGTRVPGRSLSLRPALGRWLEQSGCAFDRACSLDFARAPFRLEAIVNRMDLRLIGADGVITDAGEGRFVFAVQGEDREGAITRAQRDAASFSVIFEYALPAKSASEVKTWAARWHALGALTGEDYRAALQRITDDFARNAAPQSLHHIRTSEIGAHPWELRDFHPDAAGGLALERGKHNDCTGCHLDRADFEHIHARDPRGEASLSRFLVEKDIPRRQRDLDVLLSPSVRDPKALRATDHVD